MIITLCLFWFNKWSPLKIAQYKYSLILIFFWGFTKCNNQIKMYIDIYLHHFCRIKKVILKCEIYGNIFVYQLTQMSWHSPITNSYLNMHFQKNYWNKICEILHIFLVISQLSSTEDVHFAAIKYHYYILIRVRISKCCNKN